MVRLQLLPPTRHCTLRKAATSLEAARSGDLEEEDATARQQCFGPRSNLHFGVLMAPPNFNMHVAASGRLFLVACKCKPTSRLLQDAASLEFQCDLLVSLTGLGTFASHPCLGPNGGGGVVLMAREPIP